jgi:ElaA protein
MPITFVWSPFEGLSLHDLHDALRLRADVFVVEQDCAYADVDGHDPSAWHLLARDPQGTLVAYLRVFAPGVQRPDAVIGRVVTGPRGQGLGTALMAEGLTHVAANWPNAPVWLSAQAHLAEWYGRLGFAVCGPGYDEDGIPHVPMRRPPS